MDGKVLRKNNSKKQLYCRPCLTRRHICCQQVLKTNTFTSYRTGKTFKSETSFNIRLNNHRKDSKNKNPILACKHFQNSNHNFQKDAKFTLIEQITKSFTTGEQLRLLLKKQENFWF